MDEQSILALYMARDECAVTETMHQYGACLQQLAQRILGDKGAAEECVNDTCLKVWNSFPLQPPVHLSAYLMQVCRYTAFAMLRRNSMQKRSAQLVELSAEMELCLPDRQADDAFALLEFSDVIERFLKTLSSEHRIVFLRRYWYAETVEEIARHRNMSVSNVKTTLHRTRKKLKTFLEKEGM